MEAVVSMAYCHPSVLMYSVGNEIADTGSANGAVMGRAITQRLRALDPTRYTINCINGMVSVMGIIEQLWADSKENVEQGGQDAINGMMNNLADAFASIMQLPVVGDATEEACAYIAAFRPENYGKVPIQSPWAWSDTVGSWSFEGREGKPVQLEVYADAEEVELFLSGKSAGKAIITEKDRYKAAFELLWQPGTIEAVSVSEWHGLWALCAYKRHGRAVAFCRTGMCGGFVSPAGCGLRPDPGSRRKWADFAAEKRHCQRLHRRPRRAAWLRFR